MITLVQSFSNAAIFHFVYYLFNPEFTVFVQIAESDGAGL
jgi:hypothetical protein